MKTLKEIEEIIRLHKPELKEKFKVKKIGIFGSYAKGEQKKKSDIDILVDFYEPVGWEFIDLGEHIEQLLDLKVDLVTPQALKRQIKESVLKEVVII